VSDSNGDEVMLMTQADGCDAEWTRAAETDSSETQSAATH